MESLSEETWDVVIAGTGLPQSLLALSLSRSGKKVLHLDRNGWYGGEDAGLSLPDADVWIKDVIDGASSIFAEPSQHWVNQSAFENTRGYTIGLRPQVIHARSAFLPTLVSSKIAPQLEFVAVGSWWVLNNDGLRKIPSTREDVFNDDTLSMRDKRGLMKFLRFVLQEYDESDQDAAGTSSDTLEQTLEKYKIHTSLHSAILALALSSEAAPATSSLAAVRNIRQHLQSIGHLGPGFGAVVAKYGGNAEIAQVACRAQAVGGGVYLLGHGIADIGAIMKSSPSSAGEEDLSRVTLTDGTIVSARWIVGTTDDLPRAASRDSVQSSATTLHSASIVLSPLKQLFAPSQDNAPTPAAVVVLVESQESSTPIYLQVHNEDTGECRPDQCVIYATMRQEDGASFSTLENAVQTFLSRIDRAPEALPAQVCWNLTYKSRGVSMNRDDDASGLLSWDRNVAIFTREAFNVSVDDNVVETVRRVWAKVLGVEAETSEFLRFEDREQHDEEADQE